MPNQVQMNMLSDAASATAFPTILISRGNARHGRCRIILIPDLATLKDGKSFRTDLLRERRPPVFPLN
jgi:hypothetical protein